MLSLTASAKIDIIETRKVKLLTAFVKPGVRQYIIYMQDPKKPNIIRFWYWSKDIKPEIRGREEVITNKQSSITGDTLSYRSLYSVNRASEFLPLFHSETGGEN